MLYFNMKMEKKKKIILEGFPLLPKIWMTLFLTFLGVAPVCSKDDVRKNSLAMLLPSQSLAECP